jgi:L,D-transpeptidase YcbB
LICCSIRRVAGARLDWTRLRRAPDAQWNRAAIDAAIATGQHQEVPMARKVPVAWIYLTAWMTKDQTIQFRNDIYNQDEQLLEATAEEAAFFSNAADHPLTAHMAQ